LTPSNEAGAEVALLRQLPVLVNGGDVHFTDHGAEGVAELLAQLVALLLS